MEIAHQVAGYSYHSADILRLYLAKRLTDNQRQQFIVGAQRKGVDNAQALKIFNFLFQYSEYTFTKAHALASALVVYWGAYLNGLFVC